MDIGTAARTAMARLTDSPEPSKQSLTTKPVVRFPETIEECQLLREWACNAPPSRPEPATQGQIAAHLANMDVALPRRAMDDAAGEKRVNVYAAILKSYSSEQLGKMARRACETLEWFPTPKQCLDILAQIMPQIDDRQTALAYCREFTQARFEAWLGGIATGETDQQAINEAPERWRLIAHERGALRRDGDGYSARTTKTEGRNNGTFE